MLHFPCLVLLQLCPATFTLLNPSYRWSSKLSWRLSPTASESCHLCPFQYMSTWVLPVVDPELRHCVQGHGAWPSLQHLLSQLVWGCNENGSLELAEQQEGHEGRASDTKAHNINPHYWGKHCPRQSYARDTVCIRPRRTEVDSSCLFKSKKTLCSKWIAAIILMCCSLDGLRADIQ